MSATTDEMAACCTLTAWDGDTTLCRWCSRPLVGRQTAWCSRECSDLFWCQHEWGQARAAALVRDGWTCRACHRGPALDSLMRLLVPTTRDQWRAFQAEHPDLVAAWWEFTSISPEVNHIEPRWGRTGSGCWNHVDGLEVLCHEHHLEHTARWRGIRKALKECFGIDIAAPTDRPVTVAA